MGESLIESSSISTSEQQGAFSRRKSHLNVDLSFVSSQLAAMQQREEKAYSLKSMKKKRSTATCSTLSRNSMNYPSSASSPNLKSVWRRKMCIWSFRVVDHFNIPRDVVSTAMSYYDRFLSNLDSDYSSRQASLVGLTALFMAIKVTQRRHEPIATFELISSGKFTCQEIEDMERRMLFGLKWNLTPPTHENFIHLMLKFFPQEERTALPQDQVNEAPHPVSESESESESEMETEDEESSTDSSNSSASSIINPSLLNELTELSVYFSEILICDHFACLEHKNSIVALASILYAMDTLSISNQRKTQFQQAVLQTSFQHNNDITTEIFLVRKRLSVLEAESQQTATTASSTNSTTNNNSQGAQQEHSNRSEDRERDEDDTEEDSNDIHNKNKKLKTMDVEAEDKFNTCCSPAQIN